MRTTRDTVDQVVATMPAQAHRLAAAVHGAGGVFTVVGGAVRDIVLGGDAKDWDIVVFGLDHDTVGRIVADLGAVDQVGKAFGVYKVGALDIALPRTDSLPAGADPGRVVATVDRTLRPEQDLARRDFTCNSMAVDPVAATLHDPFGGHDDTRRRLLRVTNPAQFGEDPLRVLRAVSLTGRLGLTADPATRSVIGAAADGMGHLPAERVWTELAKLAGSAHPGSGLRLGLDVSAFTRHLPALTGLVGVPQHPDHHPEGDACEHTVQAVDAASVIATRDGLDAQDRLLLVMAALCHDFGKADTYRENLAGGAEAHMSHGHAAWSARRARETLTAVRAPTRVVESVAALAGEHMWMAGQYRDGTVPTPAAVRRLSARLAPASLLAAMQLWEADQAGRNNLEQAQLRRPQAADLLARAEQLGAVHTPPAPPVPGRAFLAAGVAPGRHLGAMIDAATDLVDGGATPAEALNAVVADFRRMRPPPKPAGRRSSGPGR